MPTKRKSKTNFSHDFHVAGIATHNFVLKKSTMRLHGKPTVSVFLGVFFVLDVAVLKETPCYYIVSRRLGTLERIADKLFSTQLLTQSKIEFSPSAVIYFSFCFQFPQFKPSPFDTPKEDSRARSL